MIDFETLGVGMCPVPGSFGAVIFDADRRYSIDQLRNAGNTPALVSCFTYFDIDSAINAGLDITADTIKFWCEQPDSTFVFAPKGVARMKVAEFASYFRQWLVSSLCMVNMKADDGWYTDQIRVWSRGQEFDYGLLRRLFELGGMEAPWKYDAGRDLRTTMDQRYGSTKPHFYKPGLAKFKQHHPVEDCMAQVWMLTNDQAQVYAELFPDRPMLEVPKAVEPELIPITPSTVEDFTDVSADPEYKALDADG